MRPNKLTVLFVLIAQLGAIGLTSCSNTAVMDESDIKRIENSKQYSDGQFINTNRATKQDFSQMWAASKDFLFNKSEQAVPIVELPIKPITPAQFDLSETQALRFTRIGHSSLMIQINGKIVLTDPVFSERTSPVQWAGPKRFHPVPLDVNELPEIEAVIISHNHYDHLDHDSIETLKNKTNHFIVPLGIAQSLLDWGVEKHKITELDWWESKIVNGIEFVATPSQHFSGRGAFDRDESLWASWVIRNKDHSLFFSGDTGYFEGFKEIGEKYGPFDYAFMECGAYNPLWRDIHMMPEDTIQAFKDVKGNVMVPIHNGTFDLSTHAWFDPFVKIEKLAKENNIPILTPVMGEVIEKGKAYDNYAWWIPYLSSADKISLKEQ